MRTDIDRLSETVFERLAALSAADFSAIRVLCGELDPNVHVTRQTLNAVVRQKNTRLYVLRAKKRIVAMATAVRFSTATGNHCRIEDVAVSATVRGKGLGRAIMERTIESLRNEGVTGLELTSRPSRIAANALYRKLGFRRHKTNVYKLAL